MSRIRLSVAALLSLSLVAAACGGGDDSGRDDHDGAGEHEHDVDDREADHHDGGPDDHHDPGAGPSPDRHAVTDVLVSLRRALVAKIDNHPSARPQHGLNQADIVFEENVEQTHAFRAVFHSQDPEVVGPVRSGRTQDISLLSSLNKPLLVWSGGNGAVTAAIKRRPSSTRALSSRRLLPVGENPAPHNLFANTADIWGTAPRRSRPRRRSSTTSTADDEAPTEPATTGVKVGWTAAWTCSGRGTQRPRRSSACRNGSPHTDSDGQQVASKNVVIAFVEYRRALPMRTARGPDHRHGRGVGVHQRHAAHRHVGAGRPDAAVDLSPTSRASRSSWRRATPGWNSLGSGRRRRSPPAWIRHRRDTVTPVSSAVPAGTRMGGPPGRPIR